MGRLDGKRAFCTAAGQGIGRAVAEAFAREGAEVVATDLDRTKLDGLAEVGVARCEALDVLDTAAVERLAGDGVDVEVVHTDVALETDFSGPVVDAMVDALLAEDPGARVLPYCLSGGTDNKSFSRLGIRGFGFAPLRLPAGLDFAGMFHGVDERVPTDALRFGTRVLDRLVTTC